MAFEKAKSRDKGSSNDRPKARVKNGPETQVVSTALYALRQQQDGQPRAELLARAAQENGRLAETDGGGEAWGLVASWGRPNSRPFAVNVEAFQRSHGLPISAVFDHKTQNALIKSRAEDRIHEARVQVKRARAARELEEWDRHTVTMNFAPGSARAMERPHCGDATVRASAQAQHIYRYMVVVSDELRNHPDACWIFSELKPAPTELVEDITSIVAMLSHADGNGKRREASTASAFWLPSTKDGGAKLTFSAAGAYFVVALAQRPDNQFAFLPGSIQPFVVHPNNLNEFEKGVVRGTYNLRVMFAAGAAAMAAGVGAEGMSRHLMEDVANTLQKEAERYPAAVQSIDDALTGVGPFLRYVAGALGEQVPTLIAMMIGGGVGRIVVGAAAKQIAKHGAKAMTEQEAAAYVVRQSATWKLRGAFLGATATNVEQQAGEIYKDLLEIEGLDQSQQAVLVALTGGIIGGYLETLVPFAMARTWGLGGKLKLGLAKEIAARPGLAARVVKASKATTATKAAGTVVGGATGEGLTEVTQEEIGILAEGVFDKNFDWLGSENMAKRKEAMAKAFIVGAAMGTAGAGGHVKASEQAKQLKSTETRYAAAKESEIQLLAERLARRKSLPFTPQKGRVYQQLIALRNGNPRALLDLADQVENYGGTNADQDALLLREIEDRWCMHFFAKYPLAGGAPDDATPRNPESEPKTSLLEQMIQNTTVNPKPQKPQISDHVARAIDNRNVGVDGGAMDAIVNRDTAESEMNSAVRSGPPKEVANYLDAQQARAAVDKVTYSERMFATSAVNHFGLYVQAVSAVGERAKATRSHAESLGKIIEDKVRFIKADSEEREIWFKRKDGKLSSGDDLTRPLEDGYPHFLDVEAAQKRMRNELLQDLENYRRAARESEAIGELARKHAVSLRKMGYETDAERGERIQVEDAEARLNKIRSKYALGEDDDPRDYKKYMGRDDFDAAEAAYKVLNKLGADRGAKQYVIDLANIVSSDVWQGLYRNKSSLVTGALTQRSKPAPQLPEWGAPFARPNESESAAPTGSDSGVTTAGTTESSTSDQPFSLQDIIAATEQRRSEEGLEQASNDTRSEPRKSLDDQPFQQRLENLLAAIPKEKPPINETAVAKRLETTMGVRVEFVDEGGSRYHPDQNLVVVERGERQLPSSLHEIQHAYNARRKLMDGHRSLYLGDMRADRADPLPMAGHQAGNYALAEFRHLPYVEKIMNAIDSSADGGGVTKWQYDRYQSFDELSTYPREARNIAGMIVRASREFKAQEAQEHMLRLVQISGAGLNISEQTKAVVVRAQEEIKLALTPGPHQPMKLDLRFGTEQLHGIEVVNGERREVEYGMRHFQQKTAVGRDASGNTVDGRVLIDIPLPVTTAAHGVSEDAAAREQAMRTGLGEYRDRLEELRIACEKTSSLFRELIPAIDSLAQSLDSMAETRNNYVLDLLVGSVAGNGNAQRTAQAMEGMRDQANQRADEVLRITNQLSSLARANNNIPLTEPLQTRPTSDKPPT